MIKVLLVDDHVLVRLGLLEAIETHQDMKVVGDVSSGDEMLASFQTLVPDVVVMDYRMPDKDGVQSTRELLALYPDTKVIILSVYEGEEDVWRAVKAGIKGYLSKGVDTSDLIEAISTVASGSTYFPSRIAQKIKKRQERGNLTPREITILQLLVEGSSNKEMSEQLSISLPTVKLHVSNMMQKLNVNDRTQAAIAAVQRGIIHLDD